MKLLRVQLIILIISFLFTTLVFWGAQSIGRANPNPFRISSSGTTTITVSAGSSDCKFYIKIYDLMGRLVKSYESTSYEAGPFARSWDGKNGAGRYVKSGVYFVYVSRVYQDTSKGSDEDKFRLGVIR